jgi:hypothetical protein
MRRAAAAALWLGPLALCLAIYWPGLLAWFQTDDFGWLNLAYDVRQGKPLLEAMFEPQAQGTFRILSERAFFLTFYNLFGLDALPYRILVFLTVFGILLLLNSIARRLTGSAAAGFWAAALWVVNIGMPVPMTMSAMYNQALCALFLLLAFRWLLLYVKTGRRRHYGAQWAAFLLGFGALELMVVYPAIAAAYTWVFARRHFVSTLPMLGVSIVYAILNRYYAPAATGLYAMYFDASIPATLAKYWGWAAGVHALQQVFGFPALPVIVGATLIAAGVAAFIVWRARRGDWLPAFFALWFVFLLAPYVPLREHVTDYYLVLPATGFALLGAYALVRAPRAASVPLAAIYLASAIPCAVAATHFYAARSWRARELLAGVARAAQLHPNKAILLTDVDTELFYAAVLDNSFRLVGAPKVYLAPGSEKRIPALAGIGDPAPFTAPAPVARRAMETWSAVVYSAAGPRLRNITSTYRPPESTETPHLVNAANPLTEYLLGKGWHQVSGNHRWMGKRASVRIAGPRRAGARLYVSASSVQPLEVTAWADGTALGTQSGPQGDVRLQFPLPESVVGRPSIEVTLEVSRTVRPPHDGRELGLAFGMFEVK